MRCPRCGSTNVQVQAVVQLKKIERHHPGFLWWFFVGWWWVPLKWIYLTIPALIFKFCPRRTDFQQETVSKVVCQDCGYVGDC